MGGGVLGDEDRIEGRPGIDQWTMAPVKDKAARRRNAPDTNPVAVGHLSQLVALDDLEIVEARAHDTERDEHERAQHRESRLEPWDRAIGLWPAKPRCQSFCPLKQSFS